ncbi:glycerol-3-phosphate 1-O-acyltransferase PlsY [Anaerococcus sp. mt242]|uniref:glycerol-3-phosphate 1-O-acyltransferase PlsY n=1 Tax=Anaerococcus sp. mt242 TaxID=2661917 RepID=UPI001934730A|nr:glycerol-3-phosphate 1-O-acyltransferase PlsY [Anaerococcus sp. mt242]MBM0045741.1 glycerol-3-phosphate 1-O-acyltransferase PlsY [Anaerococcus sp. mt242]
MIFIIALISYIIGSIPSAYLIGKYFFNTDIRALGSGNVGSTNALRNFGRKAGIATLICDAFKGFIALFIADKIGVEHSLAISLVFVVLGHMYSVFLHFKSGKGVATSFGAFIYLDIKFVLILVGIFILVVLVSRMVSLGSILGALSAIIIGYFYFGLTDIFFAILIIATLIIYKHRSNIQRIINNKESKIF